MTHLSLSDRETIESMLKENKTFTKIGELLKKHRTSISNEILKHRINEQSNTFGKNFVMCKLEPICEDYHGIGCTKKCPKFKPQECLNLSKPPYVCNGCKKKNGCSLQKFYYRSKIAHEEYTSFKTESREGIHISKAEINKIEEVIAPLIKKQKQSINQVYINHPDLLYFSKTTFYRLIDLGIFSFRNIDLPRRVRYKVNSEKRRTREETLIRVNRTYKDYLNFIENHKTEYISIVQMDTVEGTKGGKCFLTLLLVQYNLMFIYLLDTKTKESVINIFKKIKNTIGISEYRRIFQVILTDNGSEFFDPESIELDSYTGELISHVFYCDPSASYQKGAIEKNHEYIRYILPKPSSFNNFTQEDCNLLMSHINSIPRDILKGNTPYKESLYFLNEEILRKMGISLIKPDNVTLSPDLLKKKDKN